MPGSPLPDWSTARAGLAGQAPGPFAVAAGLLGVLRGLAADTPLLVAVDDLPWLDPASAAAVRGSPLLVLELGQLLAAGPGFP